MATYNVAHAKHATLGAATVDTVNLSDPGYLLIVRNRGANDLYFRLSGGGQAVDPVAGGNDSYLCAAGQVVAISRPVNQPVSQVRLISTLGVAYSVEAF